MPIIAGINIPEKKQIETSLTYIYGIGRPLAKQILQKAGIKPERRVFQLSPQEVNNLKKIIEEGYKVEGELKRAKMMNIKRLKEIGSWRGFRHHKGLPTRGQRTRTNTRTVRGNVRKTVGSGRKPPVSPT